MNILRILRHAEREAGISKILLSLAVMLAFGVAGCGEPYPPASHDLTSWRKGGVDEQTWSKWQKQEREAKEYVAANSTSAIKQAVKEKEIVLGMNKQEVIASRGLPRLSHRTAGSWGIHEQWVYGLGYGPFPDKYLYFENGVLTAWQN